MDGRTTSGISRSADVALARLADDLAARVRGGEPIDWDAVAHEHPEHVGELRDLVPAMAALGELSASGNGKSVMPAHEPPSGVLGDFRIVREVGRGGMGVVYEAEQISLGRRVALKVLPFAATMDPKHLQRFQNEARAAASLHHANIGPVFGVGCERGVYFYAMQFIEGVTLARVISDMNPPAAAATAVESTSEYVSRGGQSTLVVAGLSTEHGRRGTEFCNTAANLITQAAEALEHAHSLGIVHRDVKPGNLMVDGSGKLWVADFGLAKMGAEAGLTMSGDLIGTLRYMSPEQAMARHGLVDHRADIYALGATLYELLTGRPVITGTDKPEILRQIAFEDPAAPGKLNRVIPTDLETIVLKAIEKNPSDRYASAKELADDLRNFLAGEAIKARRPSLARRTAKWARRHQAIVTTSAAALAVLLVGLGVAVGKVSVAKRNAEEREAETRAVLNFVEERIFSAARPEGTGGGLGRGVTLRKAIEAAMPHVEEDFKDKPLIEARLRMTLGLSFHQLGDLDEARRQFEAAHAHYVEHRGSDHADTVRCGMKLANVYAELGLDTESLRLRLHTYEKLKNSPDHPNALAAATNLANGYDEAGQHQKAFTLRENTLKRMLRLVGPDHAETDLCKNNLAISYARRGNHGMALKLRKEALDSQRRRPIVDATALAAAMNNLARSYQAHGHEADAVRLYEETLTLAEEKLGTGNEKTLLVTNNLAWMLVTAEDRKLRDPPRAVQLAREADRRAPVPSAMFAGTLGTARYRAGEWKLAAGDLQRAIGFRRPDDPTNANEAFFLAMAWWNLDDHRAARDWFKRGDAWLSQDTTDNAEVRRFRAEAAELLGIK